MATVSETINDVRITMGLSPEKSSYTVGESVTVWFRVDNLNSSYAATETTIHYYDGKTVQDIVVKTGGYGTSNIATITVTVHEKFYPCFDATVEPVYSMPIISLQKVVWQGVTVWQDGKQLAYPVVPIRGGVQRLLGLSSEYTGIYQFYVPEIHVYVSKAFSNTCTVYYANHGLSYETGCGGEYGASEVLQVGKTSVLTGYHDKDIDDFCYEPWSVQTTTIVSKYISETSYRVTLTSPYDALGISGYGYPCPLEVYCNGTKVTECSSGPPYGRCWITLNMSLRAGDVIELRSCAPLRQTTIIGIKFDSSRHGLHRVFLSNSTNTRQPSIEVKFTVYSVPEEVIDRFISALRGAGVNAFKVEPFAYI